MITIVATSILKNGKKKDFIEVTKELVEKSRREKSCISYNLYEDIGDENIVTFIEEWEDQKSINMHNESEHFRKIIPKILDFRKGKPEIHLYRLISKE